MTKPPPSFAPIYAAALYPQLATIAREYGYALAVHGSLQRDMDLIAVPWADAPGEPQAMVDEFINRFSMRAAPGAPTDKAHGRRSWMLSVGFGECAIDLSFMPAQKGEPK